MSKVLILGASGHVGSELAKILKAAGEPVALATSRQPEQPDQVHLNLVTGEGLDTAFVGVDRAFLMAPPGYTNQDQLLGPVIEAAKQNKLQKLVLMTAMGADANAEAPMRKAELILEASGVPYQILRPNWFMQNFNTFWIHGILQAGKIFLPVGQAKGSFIDVRDIALAAAKLLRSDQFVNQAFNLTGSEALDHNQVAEILSEVSGKKITYEEISAGVMRENLLAAGLPADYTEFLLMILEYFRLGYSEAITSDFETITGQAPISFRKYAEDFRQAWL
ncbi:nucleoside-diphosphate sugar epimerase [bacterium (Candidatus Blackallbacteria) CG17_big_fil_post_rev_8_21_14_2_50_48_46]|uniref:Nucleoside-diphosphate sugar epimerase n=1 Tax=bacterium (Candidatus Blackallbacteria) CG17_big_fil_post_rev_8_21_14_2_50_48_46 TaxID=2014261 RepID=A0A2M7G1Z0_9BACT|nr:MAG: nucleoside-diphosphate sugar epimerase [bacterium (Candidatus Blackallbacteria) CG18_big_fil_WC_8_21_14_2_50_49_26]PIW15762.1 MAG: nucleoside-diphosphate sugar epimerase [bacterium (Candidatus Blackallbacteria) CG17_big_fil_post_rev_8_21_14_2_50_48_46]PIW48740.1 MAG: nucleoside-diphosphate sugar epimerase [bacterium (Candidatus Blackallbacteria) CG13_big_fil_rev_8_21_14_2_50_49_14]